MKFVYLKYDIKYFLHNLRYWSKFQLKRASKKNVLYFIFEPDVPHPGLADRLKAVISLYNVAKANGYEFKFYFETPFRLSDYLMPKKDWEYVLSDLEYSLIDTRIINETSWHKITSLKPNKQYHCYNYAGNDMPWQFKDTGYTSHDLFQELFSPSTLLLEAYNDLNITDENYISVQFRFVNALEQFEGYTFFDNHLETEEERQQLIKKCRNCITDIIAENEGKAIYVFSDSKTFLDALDEDPESLEAILGGENGILNQIENTVEMALKASVGFFDVKQSSIDSDIKNSETKIKKQQEKISTYRAQLEKKFSSMETLISQMQQNYSSFLGA